MFKAFIVTVAAVMLPPVTAATNELNPDMVDRANTLNEQLSGFYHNGASVKANLTNPLMSDQPLKTADGTTFDANIGCKSSNKFMQLLAMPSNSGDVSFNIELDGDMDGTLDTLFVKNNVSGICANGYIQCSAGTWNDCKHHQWHVGSTMNLDSIEVAEEQRGDVLKACYCVNNSCGNGLVVRNLATIIKDLGAGIANAFQKVNPYYTISDVQAEGPMMRFYGQEPASCGNEFNGALANYKNNANGLSAAAFSASHSSTLFNQLSGSMAAGNQGVTVQSCNMSRNFTLVETKITDIIEFINGDGAVRYCGSDCIELTIGKAGNNYWQGDCAAFETTTLFKVKKPGLIRKAVLVNAVFDDWIYVAGDGAKIYAGPYDWNGVTRPNGRTCELSTSWDKDLNIDFTNAFMHQGEVEFKTKVLVAGRGEGYTKARIYVNLGDNHCDISNETINDGCAAYQNNSDCTLMDESVDGVDTWVNYVSTGLVPVAQTQALTAEVCAVTVTRNWFLKQRKYGCNVGVNQWNFDKGLARLDTISASASTTGYSDQQFDPQTGIATTSTQSLTMPNIPEPSSCVAACKTRKLVDEMAINNLGNTAQNRADSTRYEYFYHECSAGSCPLSVNQEGKGEELVKACQCMNEFAEAASVMQILRLSGKDMICTSGNTQPVN